MSGPTFELTEEQQELRRVAHEFAEQELRPVAPECDARGELPEGLLGRAAQAGLTSYAIPEEHGGGGVGALTASLIAEELSWGCAGLAGSIQATMFPVRPLLRAGTEEQKKRYLPLLASEEGALAAIAFTEPHAGSDLSAIRASAERDGDSYVLNGEKCYVTNGGIAAVTVVFAKVDGGMTASEPTMQFLADILGVPVDRPKVMETTALGAAYLAGRAAGLCPDLDGFAAQWRLDRRFEPRMEEATQAQKYAGWRDAVRRTLTAR